MECEIKTSCLVCGKKGQLNRGLCSTHHSRYYKEVRDLTKEQKMRYDEALMERGLLLPLQKRGPKVKENLFASIADELFATEPKPSLRRGQTDTEMSRRKVANRSKDSKKKKSPVKKRKI